MCKTLIYCLSNGKFGLVRLHSVIPMYFPAHTSQLQSSAGLYLQKQCRRNNFFLCLVCSKCYYSISVRLTVILLSNKPQSVTFQRRPTPCISSKWPKNSMQFTLGMPFLGVLGQFYRNRKGLTRRDSLRLKISFAGVFWPKWTATHQFHHKILPKRQTKDT